MKLRDRDYTVALWVASPIGGTILSQGDPLTSGGEGYALEYEADEFGDNYLRFYVSDDTSSPQTVEAAIPWLGSDWHHISVVVQSGTVSIYLDGNQVAQQSITVTDVEGTAPFTVGGNLLGSFIGHVDDIRVFQQALSVQNIETVMAGGVPGTAAGNSGYAGFQADELYAYDANGNRIDVTYTVDATQGVVAYWDFEGESGTVATDKVGGLVANFNDGGTANPNRWNTTDGAAGTAGSFYFDGDDALTVDAGANNLSPGESDFSFSLWIKPDAGAEYATLLEMYDYNATEGYWLTYSDQWDSLSLGISDGTFTGYGYSWTSIPELSGQWHHIAVSLDRDGDLALYLDGVALDVHSQGPLTGVDPEVPFSMGNSASPYASSGYSGHYDEVRVYSRAITHDEVLALAAGNLSAVEDRDVATGDHNRISSDGTYAYAFDDQGNRISRTHLTNGEVDTYEWDVRNRLVKVTTTDNLERAHITKHATSDAVVDQAGNLQDGFLTGGATWTNADLPPATGIDWAIDLNGQFLTPPYDAVQLGHHEALGTTTGELTAGIWVKPDVEPTFGGLFGVGGFAGGGYMVYLQQDPVTLEHQINLIISDEDASVFPVYNPPQAISVTLASALTGAWHHVAFTLEHGGDVVIYLDGAEIHREAYTLGPIIPANGPAQLGSALDGKLADFRVYHRALSASEITTLQTDASAISGTLQTVEYTYDMYNRRIGKVVDDEGDGVTDLRERYVWDVDAPDGKGNVVLDFVDENLDGTAAGDELSRRYLWGNAVDQIFAQENVNDLLTADADDVLWTLTDNLGSVRDVVQYDDVADETNVVEHYTYSSFGETTSGDPTIVRYNFTAQEIDIHIGHIYMDQRWFDTYTGQFISPDPIEDDLTNDVRYVNNSPTNGTDPNGLEAIDEAVRWGQAVNAFGELATFPINPYAQGRYSL